MVSVPETAPGAGVAPSSVIVPPPSHGVVVVALAMGETPTGWVTRASALRRPWTAVGANAVPPTLPNRLKLVAPAPSTSDSPATVFMLAFVIARDGDASLPPHPTSAVMPSVVTNPTSPKTFTLCILFLLLIDE